MYSHGAARTFNVLEEIFVLLIQVPPARGTSTDRAQQQVLAVPPVRMGGQSVVQEYCGRARAAPSAAAAARPAPRLLLGGLGKKEDKEKDGTHTHVLERESHPSCEPGKRSSSSPSILQPIPPPSRPSRSTSDPKLRFMTGSSNKTHLLKNRVRRSIMAFSKTLVAAAAACVLSADAFAPAMPAAARGGLQLRMVTQNVSSLISLAPPRSLMRNEAR
jgi:hypothetical protein